MVRDAVVETERLILHPFVASDLDALFAIHQDARVGRYTFRPTTPEQAAERYQAAEVQREGCGAAPWVVRTRDETVVGYGGLLLDTFDPGWGIELAYFFGPEHWGHGYATELARAAVRYGFEALALVRIVSFAQPANVASLRVLEKTGFRLLGYLSEMERNHYEMLAGDYRLAGAAGRD